MIVAGALLAAAPGRAEIEFAGYLRMAGGTKFVLTDPAQRKNSDWLEIGGRFDGYAVTAFDAETETLTVTKDGASARLILKSAAIKPAPSAEDGPWDEAALTDELEANRKWLVAINTELNDGFRKLQELQNGMASAAAQRELMTAMTPKALLRGVLNELVQLQSDLILFIQMRREDDENAVKTRTRVAVLRRKLAAQKS